MYGLFQGGSCLGLLMQREASISGTALTHLCPPLRSTFAILTFLQHSILTLFQHFRETQSPGPLRSTFAVRETQSLGQQMLTATVGINRLSLIGVFPWPD